MMFGEGKMYVHSTIGGLSPFRGNQPSGKQD